MRAPRLLIVLALGGVALAGAFAARTPLRSPSSADASSPIRAEFAGCANVAAGPVCELGPERELVVYAVIAPNASPRLESDRGPAQIRSSERVEDGTRWDLTIPEGASTLTLTTAAGGTTGIWTLDLRPTTVPDWLRDARKARKDGRVDEALALVSPHVDDEAPNGARARGMVARIAYTRGDLDRATGLLAETFEALARAGRVSEAGTDAEALSFMLVDGRGAIAEGRHALDRAQEISAADPETRATLLGYLAVLARSEGDLRGALVFHHRAARAAQRLGLRGAARDAMQNAAIVLLDLGRYADARGQLDELVRSAELEADPCAIADAHTNLGVADIRLLETAEAPDLRVRLATEAQRSIDIALAIVDTRCENPPTRANALVERARLRVALNDDAGAGDALARSRASDPRPRMDVHLEQARLGAELAARAGRFAESLDAYYRLDELAASYGASESRWLAAAGQGEVLSAMGRPQAALSAFSRAESLLDSATQAIPLGGGHSAFVVRHDRSARGAIELWLRQGQVERARAVARRSRERALDALRMRARLASLRGDERTAWEGMMHEYRAERAALDEDSERDWSRSEAERVPARRARRERVTRLQERLDAALARAVAPSRAPQPSTKRTADTVEVELHPAQNAWVAFIARDGRVAARRFGVQSIGASEALGAALIRSITSDIADAARVRIHAFGALHDVDFRALLARDGGTGPVIEHVLDGVAQLASATAANRTVIVSDPDGNLPLAREEGALLATLASRKEATNVRLLSQGAATRAAVMDAAAGAGEFLFAGHGRATDDEWESELALAGADRLAVADIFSLTSPPRRVLLSACEGARARSDELGVAQAFVAVGSTFALAPTRPVSDAMASAVSLSVYECLLAYGNDDGALCLRDAQERLSRDHSDWDLAAYRVFVPDL